jgi:hypothetical protein
LWWGNKGRVIMGGEKKGELWEGKEGLWMMKRGSVKGGNKVEAFSSSITLLFPRITLPSFPHPS